VRPRIDSVAHQTGLSLQHVIEINSIAILKSAILAHLGATILPAAPVLDELKRGSMRSRRIEQPTISRTVVLCASRNIPLTNAAEAIRKLVQQVSQQLCAEQLWPGTCCRKFTTTIVKRYFRTSTAPILRG
jgi:LysR family nitrogen assimilation transcriptional regulator